MIMPDLPVDRKCACIDLYQGASLTCSSLQVSISDEEELKGDEKKADRSLSRNTFLFSISLFWSACMLCQISTNSVTNSHWTRDFTISVFFSNHHISAIFLINHAVNESNCLQRSHARKCDQLRRFEFKQDTANGACVSDMTYFKTCKVSSEETLLVINKATRCAWSRIKRKSLLPYIFSMPLN